MIVRLGFHSRMLRDEIWNWLTPTRYRLIVSIAMIISTDLSTFTFTSLNATSNWSFSTPLRIRGCRSFFTVFTERFIVFHDITRRFFRHGFLQWSSVTRTWFPDVAIPLQHSCPEIKKINKNQLLFPSWNIKTKGLGSTDK